MESVREEKYTMGCQGISSMKPSNARGFCLHKCDLYLS